jgi:2'-5' RNA ligase
LIDQTGEDVKRFRRAQPGRRDRIFQSKWSRFIRLDQTQDTLAQARGSWRRWQILPYIAFVIPVDDPAVIEQIAEWQRSLAPWLYYDPQPANLLHLTLHYVGLLRRPPWFLPHTWRRAALPDLAERVRPVIENCSQFNLSIGPLNAFANVLFAEVRDDGQCIRVLRTRLRKALPMRARPAGQWSYLPHITLGYWGRQPAAPVIAALEPFRKIEPLRLRVTSVKFTVYTPSAIPYQRDLLSTAHEETIATYRLKDD